jgi:o-succinylbenzoate synthase
VARSISPSGPLGQTPRLSVLRRVHALDCDSIVPVRIDRLELRLVRLPLVRFFETSFGRIHERPFVLVTVEEDGVQGVGECVADAVPFYSAETTRTAWHIIADIVTPLVLGRPFAHPADVFPALARIRGHNMAKAAVEMACWDLHARQLGQPLWQVLGGQPEVAATGIASGVSIGIQDSLEELVERVAIEREAGYRRIKIKIKPGWDIEAVAVVRERFGDIRLMVDANAAYRLEDAPHLAALDQFDLMMIEQPLDYDDVADHARLQAQVRTPICLDESIHTVKIAEEAIAAGACRIINIKPGRVGGHGPATELHDLAARHGVPVWHGGMLESGIGRAHNIHLSTLPNFTLPGDVAASRRYFDPDLVEPGIEVRRDGTIAVPGLPGIGVRIDAGRVAAATEDRLEMRAS